MGELGVVGEGVEVVRNGALEGLGVCGPGLCAPRFNLVVS